MRKKARSIALGIITLMIMACSSQKDQARQRGGSLSFAQILSEMDSNKDGRLSQSEAKGPLQQDFRIIDSNDDGFISQEEFQNAPQPQRGQRPPRNN